MIGFILSAIKIIFLLGFLILIHEGGHFLVAKWCKIKVNEFAIGFGPIIWKKQGKETTYAIRLIPLGGFVSMEGEEKRVDSESSFSNASIPKRMAVVVAGATVNIIFGAVLYFSLTSITTQHISTTVDTLYGDKASSVLQAGDEILRINDKKIRTKMDVESILEAHNGDDLKLLIKRNGENKELMLSPVEVPTKITGIYLSSKGTGEDATKIVQIDKGSSAEKQGLHVNDVIKKVNGIDVIGSQEKVIEEINKNRESITFLIQRDNKEIEFNLIPETVPEYFLGVTFKTAEKTFLNNIYYGFFETADFLGSILENLKMLFQGKVGLDQMVGPVGISNIVSKTADISEYLSMIALVSLSLGITNLLPIPALDGGKLLLLLLEAIRKKPLREELEVGIQIAGFMLLMGLSVFITYKDIVNIF